MRKTAVRKGLRLIVVALALIVCVSFFHSLIASFFSVSHTSEMYLYKFGILGATAIGSYGVILSVLGFVMQRGKEDVGVRLFPWFVMVVCMISIFFYLLTSSLDAPSSPPRERLRPGETITI